METSVLLVAFILLLTAYFGGEIFRRLGMPSVLGMIAAGLFFGYPPIRDLLLGDLEIEVIALLADVSLVFLLFFVGLKMDFKTFVKSEKRVSLIALFGAGVPFILGFFVSQSLGLTRLASIVVGICISITAEAVILNILEQYNLLKTRIGEDIVAAGVMDDTLGVIMISGLITFIGAESQLQIQLSFLRVLIEICIFAFVVALLRFLILPTVWRFIERDHSEINEFTGAVLLALLMAIVAQYMHLSSVIGAVVAGIIFRQLLYHEGHKGIIEEVRITKFIEIMTFGFFAPFFFIWIGIETDVSYFFVNPALGITLTFLAFGGKLFGVMLGNLLGGGTFREGVIVGIGMNTRGAIELIVAKIAFEEGLISVGVFSALVYVVFVTAFLSPIMFRYLTKRFKHHLIR